MQTLIKSETRVTVSVIIPAYNDQKGVDRCLAGIALQDFPSDLLEVVVVDNGSSPPVVIEGEFPFEIQLIVCDKPGSYAARNAGVRLAKGDVLVFLDADCWPEPRWLSVGVERVVMGRGHEIVGGEVALEKLELPPAVAHYQYITGFGQEFNIVEKEFSATANLFCPREAFELVGGFDERLLSGGDREWCWRAINGGLVIRYEGNAIVYTLPRVRLGSAVRQARRVVAGRKMLQRLGLSHRGSKGLAKQRSAWESVYWILTHPDLSRSDRWRVLFVAVIIRLAATAESIRLTLGGRAERR